MPELTPLHAMASLTGAVFSEEAGWAVPEHFGNAGDEYLDARRTAAVFDCSHRAKIEVSGKDAARFLHNLCSQDVLGLAPGSGCEAFFLSIKARVLAHVWIYRAPRGDGGDSYWLDAGPGQGEKLVTHLDRYLISEQVEITDRTREFAQMHLAGPSSLAVAGQVFGDEIRAILFPGLTEMQLGPGQLVHVRRQQMLAVPGLDLICRPEHASAIWTSLVEAHARPAGRSAHDVLRIEGGMPAYGRDIDETCLAPEVGRTSKAISYTKGCYLGQEPVVRIRDLGQVHRCLRGITIAGQEPVAAGAKVFHAGSEVGSVTSSAYSPGAGCVVALAWLRRGSQDSGTTLEIETATGRRSGTVGIEPMADGGAKA